MSKAYRYRRSPKTSQELRESQQSIVKIRAKRSPRSLPTTRDDKYRSNALAKSWKQYRKKQYKCLD